MTSLVKQGLARPAAATTLTVIVVAAIEVSRVNATPFPIPFLSIYLTIVAAANLGGRVSGVASGSIGSAYVLYSAWIGFGPATLTGGVLPVLFGTAVFILTGWALGTTRDQARALIRRLKLKEEQLNSLVEQRTAALEASFARERETSDKLRQAQKMEALGQLTGGIAHDFNNLLGVMLGHAELLDAASLDENARRHVQEIVGATSRAAALTNRLLAFSRQQNLAPSVIDSHGVAQGIQELLARTLGEDIGIEVHRDEDLWPVLADPVQLENALLNIALNARHAMPHGGKLIIEVTNVQVAPSDDEHNLKPGDYVRFRVTDTGCGMEAAVAERVFDPFFSTKPLGQGTGLGLSMVHGFASQSNGAVDLTSELGVGTTVSLYLPKPLETLEPDRLDETLEAHDLSARILVVEDDPGVRAVVTNFLSDFGCTYEIAGNAQEALDLLARDRFDLLFTDIGLPGGMNGIQLAREALMIDEQLAVLFTSGYVGNSETAVQATFDAEVDVLNKPYRKGALHDHVKRALANRTRLEPDRMDG